jgi:hypothetical protein
LGEKRTPATIWQAHAFRFAILNVSPRWNGEDPDAEFITLAGKPASPSAICGPVMNYDDLMPEYIYEVLRELGYADADLRTRPAPDS